MCRERDSSDTDVRKKDVTVLGMILLNFEDCPGKERRTGREDLPDDIQT